MDKNDSGMRLVLIASLAVLIIAELSPVDAKCIPYSAYIYEGFVEECRPVMSEDIRRVSKRIDAETAKGFLNRQPLSIFTVRVSRMVQVARCDWERGCEQAVIPWKDVSPTGFRFQLDGDCSSSGLDSGHVNRFYAVRPCCDVFPSKSGRCALGLKVILEPPVWAVDIVKKKR